MNGFNGSKLACSRVIAMAERSAGNESVGSMWIEARTFDSSTPIEDILEWGKSIDVSGKLFIVPDMATEAKRVDF